MLQKSIAILPKKNATIAYRQEESHMRIGYIAKVHLIFPIFTQECYLNTKLLSPSFAFRYPNVLFFQFPLG